MQPVPTRYPALVRYVHWISAALVLLAYVTSESAEDLGEGGGGQWHAFAGLALLLLFLPRLAGALARRRAPMPAAPANPVERIASVTIHAALLLFVVVQPLLGVLSLWAEGHAVPIPLTTLGLAPMLAIDAATGHALEEAHEVVGNAFYAVIGLHVAASLWHHYVRRDGVLRRML